MALFSRTKAKKNEEAKEAKPAKAAVSNALPTDKNLSSVILKPRITEKAVRQNDMNVYTFIVHKDATKYSVSDAVQSIFKVTPVKVNIVNKAPRQFMSRSRGRVETKSGMKKAYVYLKKGDRIDLV